ncbi:MAG: hypothetical protein ACI9XO_002637 [Paraglaciecola sp.]|jgi:hypothetical protein
MDNFEKYIKDNRSEMDDMEHVPIAGMWAKINGESEQLVENNLRVVSKVQIRKIRVLRAWVMGLAASVLVLLVAGVAFWSNSNNGGDKMTHFENPLAAVSAEMAETEQDFKRRIAYKEQEINTQAIDKQLFVEIFEELELLEKINLEYQQDIPEFQEKEQLIQTLTKYYEQKIRILERLSKEIEQQNHYQKKKYEKHL